MQNGQGDDPKLPAAFSESHERKIIFLLCVLAAIHVFIYSAAFPFFNNVDEPAQFDLVLRYSHGQAPRGIVNTSREASAFLAIFCSCAYLGPSAGPIPPPPWTEPEEKMRQDLEINSTGWQTQQNYEVSEPPLYYALAGSWWHIGQWTGLEGGRLLYWLRFLNIAFVVALVWAAYMATRIVFPENLFLKVAVPSLVAFMPQTAFYSIGNDTLSALCFGAAFICLFKWYSTENLSTTSGAFTGLAFAATCLTKMTSLPLLLIACFVILVRTWLSIRRGKFRSLLPALAAFLGCALPPVVAWMLWCKAKFGDFTGSKLKTEHLGWTIKPFAEWWHHPIYSPGGFWTYLCGQFSTFWQGEFEWYYPPHARPLELPGTDVIYTLFSLSLIFLALPGLSRRINPVQSQRRALMLSLACFAIELGFFAVMSVIYDFHDCNNPSRQHPYFHAGRMLLGALIPFLLLIAYGLDRGLNRLGAEMKWGALVFINLAMLVAEIVTDWPAFSNNYNWFHLP